MRHPAPNFNLPDQDGVIHKLDDYRGRWLVLYFYPNDRSLNCTREACNFRDEYRVIHQFGNADIVGVNKANIESHKRFAVRHHLNFPLLSDTGHKVTSAYGAWRAGPTKFFDRSFGTRRNTYLIDPEGNIAKTYYSVDIDVPTHAEQVINDLQALQSASHASA